MDWMLWLTQYANSITTIIKFDDKTDEQVKTDLKLLGIKLDAMNTLHTKIDRAVKGIEHLDSNQIRSSNLHELISQFIKAFNETIENCEMCKVYFSKKKLPENIVDFLSECAKIFEYRKHIDF